MSTRSRIGMTNPDNTITSIYCHHDGYITGVGSTLFGEYQNPADIHALMLLGDISGLHNTAAETAKTAYDDDSPSHVDLDVTAFLARTKGVGGEYAYLWCGTWMVWSMRTTPLTAPEDGVPLELARVTNRLTA